MSRCGFYIFRIQVRYPNPQSINHDIQNSVDANVMIYRKVMKPHDRKPFVLKFLKLILNVILLQTVQ